jgi:hypothetical protein
MIPFLDTARLQKAGLAACAGRRVQVRVVYKRPTDLALREDVPVVCNLLLADIVDEGVVTTEASERPCPGAEAKFEVRTHDEAGW